MRWISIFFLSLLVPGSVLGQPLAFPGAEGFGRFATGGRGGSVCIVNSLASRGPGTLRSCLETTGARTVVFRIGGTISAVNEPIGDSPPIGSHVTIACQTAPGDGVLIKAELKFRTTQNVIMRYCRVRPGDVPDTATANTNAILFHEAATTIGTANSMIFDHVSMGTANDDTFGGYGPGPQSLSVTIQHSLMSEGVRPNGGPASWSNSTYGVGASGQNGTVSHLQVSWLHNLIISYSKRCPIMGGGRQQLVNNICQYIGAGEGMHFAAQYAPIEANVVNNSFRANASDQTKISLLGCGYAGWGLTNGDKNCKTAYENASNIYVHGNIHNFNRPSAASGSETAMLHVYTGTNILNTKVQSTTPVAGFPTIASQLAASAVRQEIIDNAGANYPLRDTFDLRAINDVMNEPPTGRICGLFGTPESACLTYMTYRSGTAPTDSDNDGMPNSYETANGLNPNSAADGAAIISGGINDGYSNLEVYLNQIVGGPPPVVEPPGPTLGDVTVCIDAHTWPITQPTSAICDSSFGTPKGALAFASRAVTSGETGFAAAFSAGAYDGTSQWALSVAAADAVTPSVANKILSSDEMMQFLLPGGTIDGEYDATSMPTDSITWASGNTLSAPALGKVLLLGGNDLTVKVGTFTGSASLNGTVTVPVPFLADMVLVQSVGTTAFDTSAVSAQVCLGAAIQLSGVITQASVGHMNVNNAAGGNMGLVVDTRYACALTAAGATTTAVELSAFTSSNFTATTRVAGGSALLYGYMALKFNGKKVPFLQVIDTPVSPGLASITVPGLTPEFALLLMSLGQTVNTLINTSDSTGDANAFGVGMMTATQQGAVGYVAEDAANPHDVESFVASAAVRLKSLADTISHEATGTGMTANTLSLNYSVAAAPVRKWVLVGWGAVPAAPSLVTQKRFFW